MRRSDPAWRWGLSLLLLIVIAIDIVEGVPLWIYGVVVGLWVAGGFYLGYRRPRR